MIIKNTCSNRISENEVTSESVYTGRRDILKKLGFVGAGSLLSSRAVAGPLDWFSSDTKVFEQRELTFNAAAKAGTESLTPETVATSYNNFYEFGTGKDDPKANAKNLR